MIQQQSITNMLDFGLGRTGFVELKDGRLLALAYDTDALKGSLSTDNGRSWDTPVPLIDKNGKALEGATNFSVIRLTSGKLAIQYCRTGLTDISIGQKDSGMFLATSDDEGQTWSKEYRVNLPGNRAWPYCDAMIQTQNGRLILPVRYCFAGKTSERDEDSAMGTTGRHRVLVAGHAHYPEIDIAIVYYSDDEGRTWEQSENEIITWPEDGTIGAYAVDEPMVAEADKGRLLMFARSTLGRIVEAWSDDDGISWTRALPNSLCNSYSPASLRRIPTTGDLHCVWNQVTPDEIRRGYRRSRLTSAVSQDAGKTWGNFKTLDRADLLDASPRQPCSPVEFVVAEADCGEMPENYCIYRYPIVRYVGDLGYIMYDRETFKYPESPARKRILRTIPIRDLYDATRSDLRLSNDIGGMAQAGAESIED